MREGLKIDVLNEWANKILEDIRAGVPDEKNDPIQLRFTRKDGKKFEIHFRAPSECVGIVKEPIEEFIPQMPLTTQQAFQALLDRIELKAEERTA
jgi:hypothetical protein